MKYKALAEAQKVSIFQVLEDEAAKIVKESHVDMAFLAKNLHILPYFHGNRSPR